MSCASTSKTAEGDGAAADRRRTVLLVFHADRGHFMLCLPLAAALADVGFRCELWTNGRCRAWLPPPDDDRLPCLNTRFMCEADDFAALVAAYKKLSSSGDSDADGRALLLENGAAGAMVMMAEEARVPLEQTNIIMACASEADRAAFKRRLEDDDIAAAVCEGVWGKWAASMAKDADVPMQLLMPSYLRPFRAVSGVPMKEFSDDECRIRDRDEDMDEWPAEQDVAFVLASCLRRGVPPPSGRSCFGAFLPLEETAAPLPAELAEWLDGADLPQEERRVTLVVLGSVSVLSALSAWAEADLLKGCLAASPRVLAAMPALPSDDDGTLKMAQEAGRLWLQPVLPQWNTLAHSSVGCFVSHGGANSVHEALLHGKPIVPMPFFDDQFYVAERIEQLYGCTSPPLRKRLLREGPAGAAVPVVASAVRAGLTQVPVETLAALQAEVRAEDGAAAAAAHILAKVQQRGRSSLGDKSRAA